MLVTATNFSLVFSMSKNLHAQVCSNLPHNLYANANLKYDFKRCLAMLVIIYNVQLNSKATVSWFRYLTTIFSVTN